MKKCPACERTFEDTMRFCQSDGTPLVDDAPPLDPYKTMVARPADLAAAAAPPAASAEPKPDKEEEVLQLPSEPDPLKTMYATEAEIRREMESHDAKAEPVMDIPPIAPEPPKFAEPSLSPPVFGNAPPPSPLNKATPAVQSPFGEPRPVAETPQTPNFSQFKDPEPVVSSGSANPFDPGFTPDRSPTPALEPIRQQEIMQNPSFIPPPAATGQNKTLPIVSLIAGIVSLCCWLSPVTGIVAVITGYMGIKNANNDPNAYGGKGLAIAGMITGGILFLIGIAYWIFIIFFNGLALLLQAAGSR